MLGDSSTLLPAATYERDPTVDYQIHRAALYAMATCHSLRAVDDELIGDPLDIKMFEYTGWSFEEFAQTTNAIEGDTQNGPTSISRPPAGLEFDVDDTNISVTVRASRNIDISLTSR